MSDCNDFLGNKLNVGDLIVYTDSDGMPGISTVEKLSDTRCYYNYTFYGKFCSEERLGYRSLSQIISLKAFNVKEDDVKIFWKLSKDNKDMIGNIITVGSKVVGQVEKSFQFGEVVKINPKTCRVKYNNIEKEKNEHTSHLLIVESK